MFIQQRTKKKKRTKKRIGPKVRERRAVDTANKEKAQFPKFFLTEIYSCAPVKPSVCAVLFCSSTVATKISRAVMAPLSSLQLRTITLRVAHSI